MATNVSPNHRNFAQLTAAATSACIASIGFFGALAVPMRLSQVASQLSWTQLWGFGAITEGVVIGVFAAMVRDAYKSMKR